jgi:hypothetical protein
MKYVNIGRYITVPTNMESLNSQIIENHDSETKFAFSYTYGSAIYKGIGRQYIHYAPYVIQHHYDDIENRKEELLVGILPNNPQIICKSMDYSVVAKYGTIIATQDNIDSYIKEHGNYFDVLITEQPFKLVEIKIRGNIIPVDEIMVVFMSCIACNFKYYLFNCDDIVPLSNDTRPLFYDRNTINMIFGWCKRLIYNTTDQIYGKEDFLILLCGPHDLIYQNINQLSGLEDYCEYSRSNAIERFKDIISRRTIAST